MRVMAHFSTSFFAKCLRVGEDGPGRGYLCHNNTFLVFILEYSVHCIVGRYQVNMLWVLLTGILYILSKAISLSIHNICFCGEIQNFFLFRHHISLNIGIP